MQHRVRYDKVNDTFKIIIASKRNWIVIIYCSLFYIAWTILGLAIIIGSSFYRFILAWLIGECGTLFIVLWNLLGKEIIEISKDCIIIKRQLFKIGPLSMYHITASDIQVEGYADVSITFTYQNQKIRFGKNLSRKEAEEVVDKIHMYLDDITSGKL